MAGDQVAGLSVKGPLKESKSLKGPCPDGTWRAVRYVATSAKL